MTRSDKIVRIPRGKSVPDWEPRRYVTSDGYIVLRWKVGKRSYVEALEHRVMGGRVVDAEHVHHINHDTADNRPGNLEPITPKEHRRTHSRIDYDEAWRLYQTGLSTIAVGAIVGCDPSTLSRGFRARGLALRGTADTQKTFLDDDQVESLYRAGVSPTRIGIRLGVSTDVVRRVIRERGLPSYPVGRRRTDGSSKPF